MKRICLPALSAALVLGYASQSFGAVQYQIYADKLKDANGAAMAANMTYIIVASTLDTSFGAIANGATFAVGSVVAGTDDRVAYIGKSQANGANTASAIIDYSQVPNLTAGDKLEIVWFPTVAYTAAATPGSVISGGLTYGAYGANDASFVAQGDPSSGYTLSFLTTDAGTYGPGTQPAAAGVANLVVVPEPSSGGLALLCGGLAWGGRAWRRRKS